MEMFDFVAAAGVVVCLAPSHVAGLWGKSRLPSVPLFGVYTGRPGSPVAFFLLAVAAHGWRVLR